MYNCALVENYVSSGSLPGWQEEYVVVAIERGGGEQLSVERPLLGRSGLGRHVGEWKKE